MKAKCPYCGRRISYTTLFHIKKQGIYECTRCKKKSKVKISSVLLVSFVAVFLFTVLFIIAWCTMLNMGNNFAGVILTALILTIYYFFTPLMVSVVPLKEYMKKDKKEQKEDIISKEDEEQYVFNRAAFDEIKRKKSKVSSSASVEDDSSQSEEKKVDELIKSLENESNKKSMLYPENQAVVPIIESVSESHVSSTNQPLYKVNHQKPTLKEQSSEYVESNENIKIEISKKRKMPDGTKYTANRKL